jgi:hypothetical protein
MKKLLPLLWFGLALVLAHSVWAVGQATPDEAKAMAIKAADYLKTNGGEKAFPEFDAANGPWRDRELYITVQDSKGVMVANGGNPHLIGKNVLELKDPDGKPFNRDIQAIKDVGWVNFRWLNPVTKAMEAKTMYEIRVGEYIVGCGAYVQ